MKCRERVDNWVDDIVHSLNSMCHGEEFMAVFAPAQKPTLAQRMCLNRARKLALPTSS